MACQLIDGNALAQQIRAQVRQGVSKLAEQGHKVHLTAVLVGATAAGELYAQRQAEACHGVGIEYSLLKLPEQVSQNDLLDEIRRLNADAGVTGIMIHLPLPKHIDAARIQREIDAAKDVEGVNPASLGYIVMSQPLMVPCTAQAAIELIKSTGVTVRGAETVVVGASPIAGKPIALLLSDQRATVTICRTATRDLAAHTRRAELLVVAVGQPGLITADHVREGAVVIDVGINRIALPDGTRKTVGDVDFESVKQKAGYLTPVPGGVGPVTVAILLRNTLRGAELMFGSA